MSRLEQGSKLGEIAPMTRLIRELGKLPGVGKRSAERMAFYLLKAPAEEVRALAGAMEEMKSAVRFCEICYNLTESRRCAICENPERDRSQVMVVEHAHDIAMFEALGQFEGDYHVLWGRLAPLDGVGPGDLTVAGLVKRLGPDTVVKEVILATHPTLEGDGTALYLTDQIEKQGVKVTRLARGLPTGYSLESAPKSVLADALNGRQSMSNPG